MEIAIISGKGGTGKSSISAALATMDRRVVIADCDVDAANLYLLFQPNHEREEVFIGSYKAEVDDSRCTGCGICMDYCRFEAISMVDGKAAISEVSCDGCYLCSAICPEKAISMKGNDKSRLYSGSFRNGAMVYGRLAPGEENSGKLVSLVRERAREAAEKNHLDTIILDGPPGIGCPVVSTITGVDRVIIVTEPTISGLLDLQRVAEVVLSFNLRSHVIINKYDLNLGMSAAIETWCHDREIEISGRIPFDQEMTAAMVHQKSIVEWNPESQVSEDLGMIWRKILSCHEGSH
jgi:MinD superfamily P-loop ATPase